MVITGIIIFGITVYAVWAVRKVRRDRKKQDEAHLGEDFSIEGISI